MSMAGEEFTDGWPEAQKTESRAMGEAFSWFGVFVLGVLCGRFLFRFEI